MSRLEPLVKRALALATLAGVALLSAPAHAAGPCGALVGANCFNGARKCLVWVAPTNTCK
jgi:hypothetical protein